MRRDVVAVLLDVFDGVSNGTNGLDVGMVGDVVRYHVEEAGVACCEFGGEGKDCV